MSKNSFKIGRALPFFNAQDFLPVVIHWIAPCHWVFSAPFCQKSFAQYIMFPRFSLLLLVLCTLAFKEAVPVNPNSSQQVKSNSGQNANAGPISPNHSGLSAMLRAHLAEQDFPPPLDDDSEFRALLDDFENPIVLDVPENEGLKPPLAEKQKPAAGDDAIKNSLPADGLIFVGSLDYHRERRKQRKSQMTESELEAQRIKETHRQSDIKERKKSKMTQERVWRSS